MVVDSFTPAARQARALDTQVRQSAQAFGLDEQTADAVARIAVAAGRQVEFVAPEQLQVVGANGVSTAEGRYTDGKAQLNAAMPAERLTGYLIKHELTHAIENTKEWAQLEQIVRSSYGDVAFEAAKTAVAQRYAANNTQLTPEGAAREVVAQWVGDNLFKEGFAQALASGDASVGNAFLQALDKIRLALGGTKNSRTAGNIAMVERLFMRALEGATVQSGEIANSFKGYDEEIGLPIYESNFPKGTQKTTKYAHILELIQDVWSKEPIDLVVKEDDGTEKKIKAQFDPTYDATEGVLTDASKMMGGNRHGTSSEQRVTLDLADDYYQIATDAVHNYSKDETGKDSATHKDVTQWHYFINDILFQEYGQKETTPYRVTINVKERSDGHFVYSFNAERQNKKLSTRRTLHADVTAAESDSNAQLSDTRVSQNSFGVNSYDMQNGGENSQFSFDGVNGTDINVPYEGELTTPPPSNDGTSPDKGRPGDAANSQALGNFDSMPDVYQPEAVPSRESERKKVAQGRTLEELEQELSDRELFNRAYMSEVIDRPPQTVKIQIGFSLHEHFMEYFLYFRSFSPQKRQKVQFVCDKKGARHRVYW